MDSMCQFIGEIHGMQVFSSIDVKPPTSPVFRGLRGLVRHCIIDSWTIALRDNVGARHWSYGYWRNPRCFKELLPKHQYQRHLGVCPRLDDLAEILGDVLLLG
jgi:hypothetical protein